MSAMVAACRELFGNPNPPLDYWPLQHAVLASIIWIFVIIGVAGPLAAWRFRKLTD